MIKMIYLYFNNLFFRFLPDIIYYNLLFLVNCIRLNKPYYLLRFNKPRTFNEHLLNCKKYHLSDKAIYADKLLIKQIFDIQELNFPQNYYVFNSKLELLTFDFNVLLDKGIIIKANHGSGLNKIFKKGEIPSYMDLKEMSNWFDIDSSAMNREIHYNLISKKVFFEELLDENIEDYKFHCINGNVKYIQVDFDRFIDHKRNIYDMNWNLQDWEINYSKNLNVVSAPKALKLMVDISEKIAKSLTFCKYVRVDLYENKGKIYLGEITFHPGGGVEPFDSFKSDLLLGKLVNT
jgi:hypothetical protein